MRVKVVIYMITKCFYTHTSNTQQKQMKFIKKGMVTEAEYQVSKYQEYK